MSVCERPALPERELLALTDRIAGATLHFLLQSREVRLPPSMEREDLRVIARTAAWAAAQAYDPARGASFDSWVIGQVRWAIREACRQRKYGGARTTARRLQFVRMECCLDADGNPIEWPDPHDGYTVADARLIAATVARVVPERTWRILYAHFGLAETCIDLGREWRISRCRVDQICSAGRARAREALG